MVQMHFVPEKNRLFAFCDPENRKFLQVLDLLSKGRGREGSAPVMIATRTGRLIRRNLQYDGRMKCFIFFR
ncbi:MAG: hypothetical protein BM485_12880 [Desulfobulbaceae bacterium DB1]|nr:MAG: hypothetical protein BM485_12880 [Desulfobulbaceae bacterium DB1]